VKRHCRNRGITAALPPACSRSGIAAIMLCRQHALKAALPPATSTAASPPISKQRPCRQSPCSGIAVNLHAAALPPISMQRHCRQCPCSGVATVHHSRFCCSSNWVGQAAHLYCVIVVHHGQKGSPDEKTDSWCRNRRQDQPDSWCRSA
jgi:hypothetical protein